MVLAQLEDKIGSVVERDTQEDREDRTKDSLIRSYITKVCESRKIPDSKIPVDFYITKAHDYRLLLKKVFDRKSDVPSVDFLVTQYKFSPEHDKYTITDVSEMLERIYTKETTKKHLVDFAKEMRMDFDGRPVDEELQKLMRKIGDVKSSLQKSSIIDISNEKERLVDDYFNYINNRKIIETGWKTFDTTIVPEVGQFTLICAPTKRGKTTALTNSFVHTIKKGIRSMYVSLEMTHIEMANKILASFSGGRLTYGDLRSGKGITKDQYAKMIDSLNQIPAFILTRSTEAKITLDTVEKYIVEKKPEIVYIDYLGILDGIDLTWNAPISAAALLKQMAQRTNTYIIAAVQADPNITKEDSKSVADELTGLVDSEGQPKIPQFTDVRGLKNLAFDADNFIGLNSKRSSIDPSKMTFYFECSLNRHGEGCEWQMIANFRTNNWQEIPG